MAVALLVVPGEAAAYLDPGAGSLILQALVGGAMATAFVLRRRWQMLKNRITGKPSEPSDSAEDAPET